MARLTALATTTPGAARTAAAAALHAMLASRARGRAAGASGQAHATELVRVGGLALCRVLLQVSTLSHSHSHTHSMLVLPGTAPAHALVDSVLPESVSPLEPLSDVRIKVVNMLLKIPGCTFG